jgi:hypothetical protein
MLKLWCQIIDVLHGLICRDKIRLKIHLLINYIPVSPCKNASLHVYVSLVFMLDLYFGMLGQESAIQSQLYN